MSKQQPPPSYAPGYQASAPQPQIVQQPAYAASTPVVIHQPVVVQGNPPEYRFFGCCAAKIGWSIIYGIILVIKVANLATQIDEGLENQYYNVGFIIELAIFIGCIICLFIGMYKQKSPLFWPIIAYTIGLAILQSVMGAACLLYVFGAQNFSRAILGALGEFTDVPFMPKKWDTDDSPDNLDEFGEVVEGGLHWLGMLMCFFGFGIAAAFNGVIAWALNGYRKHVAINT